MDRNDISNESPIIICGAHGGGTSYIAKLLKFSGLFLGNDSGNITDRKFHEAISFVHTNMWIERSLIGDHPAWEEKFKKLIDMVNSNPSLPHKVKDQVELKMPQILDFYLGNSNPLLWGWKDPRNSETAFVWRLIFPYAKWLLIRKEPNPKKPVKSGSGGIFNRESSKWDLEMHFNPPFLADVDNKHQVQFEEIVSNVDRYNDMISWIGLEEKSEDEFRQILKESAYEPTN